MSILYDKNILTKGKGSQQPDGYCDPLGPLEWLGVVFGGNLTQDALALMSAVVFDAPQRSLYEQREQLFIQLGAEGVNPLVVEGCDVSLCIKELPWPFVTWFCTCVHLGSFKHLALGYQDVDQRECQLRHQAVVLVAQGMLQLGCKGLLGKDFGLQGSD